jgi:ubiquitin-activating enzyme E1
MDRIERSNLSRQFLFRNSDIHRPKSLTAASAATGMNNTMKCAVYEDKVAVETEHVFNDDFYESLDFVCTALDNVEARLYVDQKCLFHHLPMLESGTLGTKCHTQVVVPGLTESYGATRDPPEKSIPMCTLKHFPNLIEHTIQWAREWFEEAYKQTAVECNMCVQCSSVSDLQSSLTQQQNLTIDTLKRMLSSLVTDRPRTFEDCIIWAR